MNESPKSASSADFVEIAVPAEHVMRVYAFLADLERGHDPEQNSTPEPTTPDAPHDKKLTADLVARMYRDSEQRHRDLLRFLADHHGTWIFTSDIENWLGVTTGSKGMAGMFGAFGRRAKHRYSGLKPWVSEWDDAHGEARYLMTAEVGEWIQQAAKEEG
jgi:hypothetical protein